MTVRVLYYFDDAMLLQVKRNVTHEFRLADIFREILLKGLAEFDDVVLPYAVNRKVAGWLENPKFRNNQNCGTFTAEFQTKSERLAFYRKLEEAKKKVAKAQKLSGLTVRHVVWLILYAWLDMAFEVQFTNHETVLSVKEK